MAKPPSRMSIFRTSGGYNGGAKRKSREESSRGDLTATPPEDAYHREALKSEYECSRGSLQINHEDAVR
jgi:hypothetical protein